MSCLEPELNIYESDNKLGAVHTTDSYFIYLEVHGHDIDVI